MQIRDGVGTKRSSPKQARQRNLKGKADQLSGTPKKAAESLQQPRLNESFEIVAHRDEKQRNTVNARRPKVDDGLDSPRAGLGWG